MCDRLNATGAPARCGCALGLRSNGTPRQRAPRRRSSSSRSATCVASHCAAALRARHGGGVSRSQSERRGVRRSISPSAVAATSRSTHQSSGTRSAARCSLLGRNGAQGRAARRNFAARRRAVDLDGLAQQETAADLELRDGRFHMGADIGWRGTCAPAMSACAPCAAAAHRGAPWRCARALPSRRRRPPPEAALSAHTLHLVDALLAQDLLHALDGVAFRVQQVADAAQQLQILRPVVAAAAAPLHRLDLRKPAFPEAQDVLGHVELARNLADRTKCLRRLLIAPPAASGLS